MTTTDSILSQKLSIHEMTGPALQNPDGSRFHWLHMGFGAKIALIITGDDRGDAAPGYPHVSIAEANAIAAELMRRWNYFEETKAALMRALENGGV